MKVWYVVYDTTGHSLRKFSSWELADGWRAGMNRPDWKIKEVKF